ncbi:outer membrane receptor protein involved in Fe transport [Sphingopyxis panaciterrae]|uniref:TonB-dependent receptor n=1 Tax=Sphingopyxis panaciterrae TaxID=363841 RepID=UPI001423B69B|nr:TonB-dependent receptor [Sphingopyxis panaciterrae]NIJ38399.1 outer membrane receptor protein involved in Fe transport [Sphingopyxis panaciterrae]
MNHGKKYWVGGISALALSCPFAALAQTMPNEREERVAADERARSDSDIVVTATRRDESILQAPISITAYSQESLDLKGVRNMEDLARMTPGISINQGTFGIKYLVIRGLSSSVGATMNGVYIDDTPVQVRSVSLTTNFYPAMFDLERVEVLRGPQGTLYGAGAMGGAVRFISAKPGFSEFTGYSRAELATTEGGGLSYEGGAAVGGPIIKDKLAFRVSAYYRRDGGYIDRVPIVANRGTARKNHNERDTFVGQAQLAFKPTDDTTITAGVFHQKANRDNSDQFWEWRESNPYDRPAYPKFTSGEGLDSYGRDRATIYSLKVEQDLGPATLISNTSITDRRVVNKDDATAFYIDIFGALGPVFGFPGPIPADLDFPGIDERAVINLQMRQRAFTQELRIQSNPDTGPLSYVAGVFYQNSRQTAEEFDTAPATDGPFLWDALGLVPVVNGTVGYLLDQARDKQFAVFGNVEYQLTDKLSVNAGLRYSYVTFDFRQVSGYKLPTDDVNTGRTSESPITPKFGIEYEPNENLMFYASTGKGFRPGGTNSIPAPGTLDDACQAQLRSLGYPDGYPPRQYRSDSTWSYEVGAKGRAGGWLTFAGDVFQIDWTDVQRTRSVLSCGNPFLDNLGKSRARGVEGKITVTPITGLSLDANFSYTNAKVRETLTVPTNPLPIVTKGDRFAPPWIISLAADYETALGTGDAIGYGHVQYDYRSGYTTPKGNAGYDPNYALIEARNFVSARLGVRSGGVNASVFVDNLLNSQDELGRLALGGGERLLRQTYRPRTWGATLSYSF